MAVIHFYKGFGLEAEKEHIDLAGRCGAVQETRHPRRRLRRPADRLRDFPSRMPEAADWFAPHYLGRPVLYGDNVPQAGVLHAPGYRAYMKRCAAGVEDLKVDLIHFDNTSLQAQAPVSSTPRRSRTSGNFSAQVLARDAREALGHSIVTFIEPPEWTADEYDRRPLFQEWADSLPQLTEYYAEMERFIRGLNPKWPSSATRTAASRAVTQPGAGHRLPGSFPTWTSSGPRRATKPASP